MGAHVSTQSPPSPVFHDIVDDSGAYKGCKIKRTEERAISVAQIQRALTHVERRCDVEEWTDYKGVVLSPSTVNLHVLRERLLDPATEARKCSFVELVAIARQVPQWFVSHWWGEPVAEFLACLQLHALERNFEVFKATMGSSSVTRDDIDLKTLYSLAFYWVCAYANNQWNLAAELSEDPAQSSFRRAIDLSQGAVSIVDGGATGYTRIWCGYEVAVISTKKKQSDFQYDVYTVAAGGPVGITQTAGFWDMSMNSQGCADPQEKIKREAAFPSSLFSNGLQVSLEHGEASVPIDKTHILNSIRGAKDLNAPPPKEDPAYDAANAELRVHFALTGWRKVLESGDPMDLFYAALAHSSLTELDMSFSECKAFTPQAAGLLAASIPPSVSKLTLELKTCPALGDAGLSAIVSGLRFAGSLRELSLTFAGMDWMGNVLGQQGIGAAGVIGDAGVIALANHLPQGLTHLELNLNTCETLSDMAVIALANALPPTIRELRLYWDSPKVTAESFSAVKSRVPRNREGDLATVVVSSPHGEIAWYPPKKSQGLMGMIVALASRCCR